MFCIGLEFGLRRRRIPFNKHNIWTNPDDAALVREIAQGNETVPTLVVGPVAMVNPTAKQVVAAVTEHAPHLL